uniref:KH domain-containing protein n=1 Tax=Parastrongyloides trichosuri TaxID=131310 RepID=A0A0N4ZEL4_PARTI
MKHQHHHSEIGSNSMSSNNTTNDRNTVKFLPTTTTIHITSNGNGSPSYINHPSSNNNNRHSGNFSNYQDSQQLTVEQILIVMEHINMAVKNNEFTASLANNIFLLCQQLKTMGGMLESNHKNNLNKVFISLRQACCRDSGQLGTPCRLKIMELIELRAMGWRPNLAHTQYYLNHQSKVDNNNIKDKMTTSLISTGTPTFNTIPMGAFNFIPSPAPQQQPTPVFVSSDQTAAAGGQPQGFYIIPATNGIPSWGTPLQQQPQQGGNIIQNNNPSGDPDTAAWVARNALFNNSGPKYPNEGSIPVVHMRQKSNNKVPQIREEITIRNADSGKIMGVKGRRIAVVEELSKTVVSFQKVDSKSRDRILTITGSTQDSIDYAKKLIDETIKRNVSPCRDIIVNNCLNDMNETKKDGGNSLDDEFEDMGIKIETGSDGTLKLCCSNPQYLAAAQVALSEYLTRLGRNNRLSMDEKELRKERRKSMPLNMNGHGDGGGNNNNNNNNNRNSFHHCHNRGSFREKRSFAGSTPNLVEGVVGSTNGTNTNNKISYTRKELQAIAEQNNTTINEIDEPIVRMINETIPEISRIRIDEKKI